MCVWGGGGGGRQGEVCVCVEITSQNGKNGTDGERSETVSKSS